MRIPLCEAADYVGLSYRVFKRMAVEEGRIPCYESPLSTEARRLYLFEKKDLATFKRSLQGKKRNGRGRPLGSRSK